MAVGSLYGITLLMLSFSETPGLNSKVPFTCVCRTLYGPLVLLPSNLQDFLSFLKYPLFEGHSCIDDAFDFL